MFVSYAGRCEDPLGVSRNVLGDLCLKLNRVYPTKSGAERVHQPFLAGRDKQLMKYYLP